MMGVYEKYSFYATDFQKAQLPKICSSLYLGSPHCFLTPNFIGIEQLMQQQEFSNNNLLVNVTNETINYFKSIFGINPSKMNFELDSDGNLLKIGIENNKEVELFVVDYAGEEISEYNQIRKGEC